MKIQKISNLALYICFAVILVVFAAFYLVGFDNAEGPALTEVLIFLMYILVAICAALMIWSLCKSIAAGSGVDDAKTGVPGTKVAISAVVILIAAIALGAALGSSNAVVATDGTVTEGFWSWFSDVMIISMYALTAIAGIGLIINLTGVIKNK